MKKQKYPPTRPIVSGNYTFGHQSLNQLVSHGFVSKVFANSAYKFAVTRCPYERAVSLYCYLKTFHLHVCLIAFQNRPLF